MNTLIPIKGQVQAYQWGGFDYLPALLNYSNNERQPQAEYWLGVHPAAPAQAESTSGTEPLAAVLAGHNCQLEFLLKILDVREMLSIQVHPTREQARRGYEQEDQQGIALSASNRNYKDTNHKPELMVALSEFWLLHGFKPEADIAASLASKHYLAPLLDVLNKQGLAAAFAYALEGNHDVIKNINLQLQRDFSDSDRCTDKYRIEFWIQRWLTHNPDTLNGLLTLFFLNLVKVNPGQALYQPAGLLHAYLEGSNVELMANSDNVLRAGLTPKHIDVAELLNVCTVKPSDPRDYLITPQTLANGEQRFPTPFDEFELSELHSHRSASTAWQPLTPEILICIQGTAEISRGEENLQLETGQSLLIIPGEEVRLRFSAPDSQVYKAKNL